MIVINNLKVWFTRKSFLQCNSQGKNEEIKGKNEEIKRKNEVVNLTQRKAFHATYTS